MKGRNGEPCGNFGFAKGDILKVRLREKKSLAGGNLRSEITILQVLEHRRASTQLRLPIQAK